jgi:hypothetical protein
MDDELRRLRRRIEELEDASRGINPDDCSPSMLLKTTTATTYPTAAGLAYACVPSRAGGTEAEGSTPTFADGTRILYAINLGGAIPPAGTRVIATSVAGGRWVFRYD